MGTQKIRILSKAFAAASFLLMALAPVGPSSSAQAFGQDRAPDHAQDHVKSAAEVDLKDPMTAKARFQPSTVEAGGTAELIVDLQMAEGYHAYLDRLKLSIERPDDFKLGAYKTAPVVEFFDSVSKSQVKGIERQSQMRAVMEVPVGFSSGLTQVKIKIVYQSCTTDHCLFPKTLVLDVPLTVLSSETAKIGNQNQTPSHDEAKSAAYAPANELQSALAKGLGSAFLLVFGLGFLTSLTPCIYPMIPITLAVLGARTKHQSHWKNFAIALLYVFGIATTYSALGVAAASTGGLFGAALSNVWIVTAIALIFVAMGLSMFGLFEVQAPGFIRNRLGSAKKSRGGYGSAFVTGLVAGVVASPCIGPVLVGLLAYIAQTQNRILGFSLLFTFAIGMGLPFIVLGLSSSALARMPKAGHWMESVKFFFGVVMIAMAFHYIRPLYPVWLFQILLGLALVMLASFYGAFRPNIQLKPSARLQKGMMLTVLAVGAAFTSVGILTLSGVNLTQSGVGRTNAATGASAIQWKLFSQTNLATAIQSKRPVLIDFSAEWCDACHEMDQTTFVDKDVVTASQQFELLRVDGTEDTVELRKLVEQFHVQGFPTYIFFDGAGKQRGDLTVFGFDAAVDFLKRMNSAI